MRGEGGRNKEGKQRMEEGGLRGGKGEGVEGRRLGKKEGNWKRELQCKSFLSPILQEASYDYMEKEGERTFLECLDQLEVANARLDDVSVLSVGVIRCLWDLLV